MSADNWDRCPKCEANRAEAEEAARKKADKAYGKVPAGEYERLKQKIAEKSEPLKATLAEYYELGIDEDVFYAHYSARCKQCGFEFKRDLREVIPELRTLAAEQ